MRTSRWWSPVVFAACLVAGRAHAQDFEERRFHVVPFSGFTFFDDDRRFLTGGELPTGGYFGGRASARLSCLFLVEVAGGGTPVETCCDWLDWGHVSANLVYSPATGNRVTPFVSLGGGWSRQKHSAGEALGLGTYEGAAGLNVKLSNLLAIRLEARDILASSPDHWNDVVLGAGLDFALGERVECGAPEAEAVEAMPEPPPQPAPTPMEREEAPPPPPPASEEQELLDKGVLTVRDIYFESGSDHIGERSDRTLEELCTIFKQHPDLQIEISGHTDDRGDAGENQELSERRADSVLDWFRDNCGEANLANFSTRGYGEDQPVGSNSTARGRALNRRIEFRVLNPEALRRPR